MTKLIRGKTNQYSITSERECQNCSHEIKDHRRATKVTKKEGVARNVLKCKLCDCVKTISFFFTYTITKSKKRDKEEDEIKMRVLRKVI